MIYFNLLSYKNSVVKFVVIYYNVQTDKDPKTKGFTNSNFKFTAIVGSCLRGFPAWRYMCVTQIVKSDSSIFPEL